jgi:16S rRNA (cytidine1402-2'-O)-methyltransferase
MIKFNNMGILYIVATPIGNLEDISIRALKVLAEVKVIACEDTRHTGLLIKLLEERYGQTVGLATNPKKYISVRDWNEAQTVGKLMTELVEGDVALVSDAGTPLLSDPGYKIVRAAIESGFKIVPVPGPFAGATAACAAGLPTNKILFVGFLPKKWELLPGVTTIIYEAPGRVADTVEKIRSAYPEAQIVIAKELTKVHEEFIRKEEITQDTFNNFKGEATLAVYLPAVREGNQVAAGHGHGQGNLQ